jgi:hypothetical protein
MRNPFKKKPKDPKPKANLVHAFDYEKHSYYIWPDPASMPASRAAKSLELTIELSCGLDKDSLNYLIGLGEKHVMSGFSKPEQLKFAMGVFHEIKLRQTQIAPIGIYFNQFAVNYIRDDEDPFMFNLQIQQEKVKVFEKAANEQNSFFFALPEFKDLCKRLNIFSENWNDVMSLSHQAERRNQNALSLIK